MQRKIIAGTELQSSTISLGGVALGSKLNEEDSFRLMDMYLDHGGNMIDTAEVYGNWLPIEPSISETTIGRWMKERNNRSRLIVTTKGAHPLLASMHISRMSPEEIIRDVEGSLRRLQVDTIDLYWLHRDDTQRPVGEILTTLNGLVKSGKIRYFGCSNWTTARIMEAQDFAVQHHIQGFSGNQMMWSLAAIDPAKFSDPTIVAMDKQMKQYHLESGLSAIPYSSQAHGLFTKWDKGTYTLNDERIGGMYRITENQNRLKRAQQLASEISLSVSQIVLGYLVSQPFPTIPIVGCHTAEQLIDSLKAVDVRLSQEQLEYLENGK